MRDSWIVVSALFASLTVATVAQADDKQACNDAYRQAQVLRNDHKLVEAREQLRICAGGSCPGFIAKDCSDWLKADESKTPSVVLAAKSPAGADLFDVKVTMDGAPLSSKLDGLAIDIDPGPHTFAFDAPEGHAEQKIVVAEGAKAQRVAVTFGGAGGAAVVTTTPGTAPPASVPLASPALTLPAAAPAAGGEAKPILASEPVQSGLSFGFRSGYAVPAGSVNSGPNSSLSTFENGQIPLWFDAGYLINPYFYVGAYFSYGFVLVPSSALVDDGVQLCGLSTVSCSGGDVRVGVDIQVRPLGTSKFQPWLGLGFLGYEGTSLNASNNTTGGNASISLTGIEWVTPQLGFDYKFLPALSGGLFAAMSLSEYLGLSESLNGADQNGVSLTGTGISKSLHEWIFFGARASFDWHLF
jgi:hypothetical protein